MTTPYSLEGASQFERWALLSPDERTAAIRAIRAGDLRKVRYGWEQRARAAQRAPEGDWRLWLILAGRGFGKTRAGAEWVRDVAEHDGTARIALVAASIAEARGVMVEGASGILNIGDPEKRPTYESSLRRLRWRNGAEAYLYSAAEAEMLRGPQHSHAWADEIAKWPHAIETWDNLVMGMRMGALPRIVATTTPRPVPLLRRLRADGQGLVETRGATRDNVAHLAPGFVRDVERIYGGTRLGRQELDGEMIDDVAGTLWPRALIETRRVKAMGCIRVRTVVAVDPPAGALDGDGGDACGIIVAALGADGCAYVLEDASVAAASPEGWARAVADAAARWSADRVVAEANNGGRMVDHVLRAADRAMPVRLVHAAVGKVARAEPVAALYEAGRAAHVGAFADLEDQMAGMVIGGDYVGPGRSPDRADALVWAMSELMLGARAAAGRGCGWFELHRIDVEQ